MIAAVSTTDRPRAKERPAKAFSATDMKPTSLDTEAMNVVIVYLLGMSPTLRPIPGDGLDVHTDTDR